MVVFEKLVKQWTQQKISDTQMNKGQGQKDYNCRSLFVYF